MTPAEMEPELCNCAALRQAARHVTQLYDRHLTPSGLRTTQFSILARLKKRGPMTINALAAAMVMDRTTMGRNIRPLARARLIAAQTGKDRRSKELHLTEAGAARLRAAAKGWAAAQAHFESTFGRGKAADMRALMRTITELPQGSHAA